jgi:hypothetical protein
VDCQLIEANFNVRAIRFKIYKRGFKTYLDYVEKAKSGAELFFSRYFSNLFLN